MAQWLGFSSGPTSGSIEHLEQHWHHKWWPHQPNCRSGPPYRTSELNAKTLKINSDCKGLNENFHASVQSHSDYRIVFEHMKAFSKQSLNNIIIIAQQCLWKNSTHVFVSYLVKLFRINQTIILIKRIKHQSLKAMIILILAHTLTLAQKLEAYWTGAATTVAALKLLKTLKISKINNLFK